MHSQGAGARFNAPSLRTPFGHAVLHAVSAEALPSKEIDRIERHHAVRTAAIRDDVAALLQRAHVLAEVCERYGDRARDVSRHVLLTRTDVDERDLTGADTPHELVVANRLKRAAVLQVLARDVLDFCKPGLSQASQGEKELAHSWVRQSIRHVQAGLLSFDQARVSEYLQMVRGRGDAVASLAGERFDRPGSLGQEIEELEAARAGRGLANARELFVDRDFQ